MVKLYDKGVFLKDGKLIYAGTPDAAGFDAAAAAKGTMAYGILAAHNTSGRDDELQIKFDAMASHDITYVGIIQTARASGMKEFPIPYVLTNCHNSLCAVGGTINEDDHVFGLSAAVRYGGIYVPAHQAVIHSYMRECMSGCGKMLLCSDSHTRYGALGTLAVGEGGPELAKQLLGRTYDISMPEVVAVYLDGAPSHGVGPQDVALAIIGAVFPNGFVKNRVLEFVGPGIAALPVEFRNGIDVMTTETTCLSSIWVTDDAVKKYYEIHKRPADFKKIAPADTAFYSRLVYVDLTTVKPMIALPFHPSNVYEIDELCANAADILHEVDRKATEQIATPGVELKLSDKLVDGKIHVDQGVIAGCAGGTFDNICAAADILRGHACGNGNFWLSAYPASQPVMLALTKSGIVSELLCAGVSLRSAFCGPCFGAGDVPANGGLSIRHTTRNFPNREGSKPGNGQIAGVALMDARSIAATAANGGILMSAAHSDAELHEYAYDFDDTPYKNRIYYGFGKAQPEKPLKFGPNITDWPKMHKMPENLLLKVAAVIDDPVTTTDELIPSGETSSYRSNPLKLAEFTLSRKVPSYVGKAKAVKAFEDARTAALEGTPVCSCSDCALDFGGMINKAALAAAELVGASVSCGGDCSGCTSCTFTPANTGIGSVIYANRPGDGSAREQAASCQRVLGGAANIAVEYATKRYRSNLINWGMLPFVLAQPSDHPPVSDGEMILVPKIRDAVLEKRENIDAFVVSADGRCRRLSLKLGSLTDAERTILLAGCLQNYYSSLNRG